MAKLVSLPEIIQNIYVKLEESGQGGSGTGGNCSSNITIDASTNKGTLNVSDGSVLSTQVLNVEDTPKAGRVTLTDKDSNSISFDAVTIQYLGKNYYIKSVVDDKLSSMVTYADIAPETIEIDVTEDSDINQLLSTILKGSPTTTLTIDDLQFDLDRTKESVNEYYETIITSYYIAITNTEITFKDGSTSNITIIFIKTTEENISNYVYFHLEKGVKIQRTDPNIPAYIDTGLKKNGNYTFEVAGRTTNGKASVLVGSYDSKTDSTTCRILGTSNKLQSMWSANNEITNVESGVDFNSNFSYTQRTNYLTISQNGKSKIYTYTNQNTSQTTNTPIYLFNDSTNNNYDNGVLKSVMIGEYIEPEYDKSYTNCFRYFIPCKILKTNEIVLIDISDFYVEDHLNDFISFLFDGTIQEDKIYRPTNGILVEAE